MVIELINTGTELMLGRVLNTHQQWICRQLADTGYVVNRQLSVPDTAEDIVQALRESLARADCVITTGGLGPTSDDLTRDMVAKLLGKPLREDPAVLAHIHRVFQLLKRPMPETTRVQALIPEEAIVLPNAHGTAPGLAIKVAPNPFRPEAAAWVIMLPGPPRELRPMFTTQVVPLLRQELPVPAFLACSTLRSTGIGESVVQEKIAPALRTLVSAGLELGYCAHPGQVDIRLAARGTDAERLVAEAREIVRSRLGPQIFTQEDEELAAVIIRLLTERRQTLAVAESCTGGHIADLLTDVPGASAAFVAGLVTYSNEAKRHFLGVQPATLAQHGAVSAEVAREMALGARAATHADHLLSVTGIAGPGGGTEEKPVGTVFIGLAGPREVTVERRLNPYDRETFKQVTAQQALELLRRTLLK